MLKRFSLAVVGIGLAACSYAQNEAGTWGVRPQAGICVSDFVGGESGEFKPKVGFVGGVYADYQATDMLGLSTGLVFSMQGAKYENEAVYIDKFDMSYLNLPVMASVYVVPGLAVKAGVQFGYLLDSKIHYVDNNMTSSSGNYELDDDDCHSFMLSIPVGLSYEYRDFVVDARYSFGLTKVFDGVFEDVGTRNNVFQLTVGYRIDND